MDRDSAKEHSYQGPDKWPLIADLQLSKLIYCIIASNVCLCHLTAPLFLFGPWTNSLSGDKLSISVDGL